MLCCYFLWNMERNLVFFFGERILPPSTKINFFGLPDLLIFLSSPVKYFFWRMNQIVGLSLYDICLDFSFKWYLVHWQWHRYWQLTPDSKWKTWNHLKRVCVHIWKGTTKEISHTPCHGTVESKLSKYLWSTSCSSNIHSLSVIRASHPWCRP